MRQDEGGKKNLYSKVEFYNREILAMMETEAEGRNYIANGQ